jgi:hypothetical protein
MNRKPLAAAIALALGASSAGAVNIETPGLADIPTELYSAEYFAGLGQVAVQQVAVDLDAGLAPQDLITITYNSPLNPTGATTAFSWSGAALPTLASESGGVAGTVAFRSAAADGSSVTYRVVTAPTAAGGAAESGGILTLPAGQFSRTGGNVTVSASVNSGLDGAVLEQSASADTILANTGSQFRFIVSNLSETVDVNSSRLRFDIGTGTPSATHTIGFNIVTNAASVVGATTATLDYAAALGTTAVTLAGDFAWLDSSSTTTGIQLGGVSTVNSGGASSAVTLNTSGQIATVLAATAGTGAITLGNATTTVIPEQALTLTSSLRYTVAGGSSGAVSGSATGAYNLNGSSVTVYSVPTNASNFIWLTNTGSTDGAAISASIDDAGTVTDLGELAVTADSNDQVDVWPAVLAAAEAAGVELTNPGRVNLTLVTEAPATDVVVSGVYRVGDDRVNLISTLDTDIAD